MTRSEGDAAIATLKRAVERYPDYGPAHSMLAFMLLLSQLTGWNTDELSGKQAAALAKRAAELDDSDPWAHMALGYLAFSMRRTDEAVEEFQHALELNPNFAAAHGYLGFALAMAGRADEAIPHCEQAIQMSPQDPQNAIFNTATAVAHYLAGRYPEAVVFGRKALQQRTQFTSGHRIYVASLAQAGQIDEAHEALIRLKEVFPDITIAWIERYVPYTAGTMPKFLEGMRKAGLE
jgi:tetratricopeptide (TPR) repeat protein